MTSYFKDSSQVRLIAKLLLLLSLCFIIFLVINYWYIQWISYNRITKNISRSIQQIASDLEYKNGVLDATKYFQDSDTPVDKPLYILTSEGFVVERLNPIEGFLDTSQVSYINELATPQTIKTPANTTWRVVSKAIVFDGTQEGSLLTAYFDPHEDIQNEIDAQLQSASEYLLSLLSFQDKILSAHKIETRNVPYSIYFSVVDKFNKVIKEDGGPPAYVDRSFVGREMNQRKSRVVKNIKTAEPFLVFSQPVYDSSNNSVGVIVMAEPLIQLHEFFQYQRNFSVVSALVVVVISIFLLVYIFGREIKKAVQETTEQLLREVNIKKYVNPDSIIFDKKYSLLQCDSHSIPIEYGSKQYDLCSSLFSSPKKRWELDEILDKNHMSDHDVNNRTFYDAMLRINNKVIDLIGIKLIVYENKTFRLNPALVPKIVKAKIHASHEA